MNPSSENISNVSTANISLSIVPKTQKISFGTDGWRGLIGEDFTFANVEKVAQAYADYINTLDNEQRNSFIEDISVSAQEKPLVVIGGDRRFLSDKFVRRAAQVLAANSINVAVFKNSVPTPLISWAVRENQADGGVMITASHNSAEYNGFKIKAPWGGSAPQQVTKKVESLIDWNEVRREENFTEFNKEEIADESIQSYRAQITGLVDLEKICASDARIIVDPIHGAGERWVESFLQSGKIQVETIRAERDVYFGGVHPEPIDSNLDALKSQVKNKKGLVGLATDGDADRVGAVNELGETMTMHEVVPLLLLHLIRNRNMTGGIVRTFSQSVLVKRIAAAYRLPIFETPIGFKYVADLMLKENILLGAEESGGIGIQGHIPERDGILNSLLFLEAVIASGKTPSEMVSALHREFGKFYFDRRDLKVAIDFGIDFVQTIAFNPPSVIADNEVISIETRDGTKLNFADESWLLFRQSGTEPVLRVYCEATSPSKRNLLLDAGCRLVLNF